MEEPRAGEHPRLRPGAESPALRRLREAKAMLDEGRITVDNFEAQKRAILDARVASFGAFSLGRNAPLTRLTAG